VPSLARESMRIRQSFLREYSHVFTLWILRILPFLLMTRAFGDGKVCWPRTVMLQQRRSLRPGVCHFDHPGTAWPLRSTLPLSLIGEVTYNVEIMLHSSPSVCVQLVRYYTGIPSNWKFQITTGRSWPKHSLFSATQNSERAMTRTELGNALHEQAWFCLKRDRMYAEAFGEVPWKNGTGSCWRKNGLDGLPPGMGWRQLFKPDRYCMTWCLSKL
jgi:hypothetical protein